MQLLNISIQAGDLRSFSLAERHNSQNTIQTQSIYHRDGVNLWSPSDRCLHALVSKVFLEDN